MALKFDKDYVQKELERIGSNLKEEVKIYLIGGCGMSFRGLKDATKDIDIVFEDANKLKSFADALEELGYKEVKELPEEYQKLGASAIMRNPDGFQTDLFYKQVCGGLVISGRMTERAEFFKDFINLKVYLVAPEDIFLFKGMTERDGDLEDMRVLAEKGLDWEVIKKECTFQEKRKIWEAFLVDRLEVLREKTGIKAPILKDLRKDAEDEIIKTLFLGIIKGGNHTIKSIAETVKQRTGYSKSWTRKGLSRLVELDVIKKKRKGREYWYYVD